MSDHKAKYLEALKYWTFVKNVLPGVALMGISVISGMILLVRSYETYGIKDQVSACILLVLCPILILYTLVNVLQRYRKSVRIISEIAPRIATLVWLDNWFHVCLSLDQEKSTLVQERPKRVLFTLWNFEKFIWLFVRYCLGGSDNEERTLSRQSKPIVLYGPEANDDEKLVVIFIGSVPFFAKESFEIYPEPPTLTGNDLIHLDLAV